VILSNERSRFGSVAMLHTTAFSCIVSTAPGLFKGSTLILSVGPEGAVGRPVAKAYHKRLSKTEREVVHDRIVSNLDACGDKPLVYAVEGALSVAKARNQITGYIVHKPFRGAPDRCKPAMNSHRSARAFRELAAEKQLQLERAEAVIQPLTFVAAVIVFAVCFWRYSLDFPVSIGAALLTVPAMGLCVSLPIGYILGNRAVWRFNTRLRNDQMEGQQQGPRPALVRWLRSFPRHAMGVLAVICTFWGPGFIYTAIFAPPVPWAQDPMGVILTLTAGAVMLGAGRTPQGGD
jgi:hypothetical protein